MSPLRKWGFISSEKQTYFKDVDSRLRGNDNLFNREF